MNIGIITGILAFSFWGFVPLYWQTIQRFDSIEITIARIITGLPLLFIYILAKGRLREFFKHFKNKNFLKMSFVSALILLFNWCLFVWSVHNGSLLDASLGYYISPICSVVMGMIFFNERLFRFQWLSLFLSIASILILTVGNIGRPWVSIGLALSFSVYGLLKKKSGENALDEFTAEMCIGLPFALGTLIFLSSKGPLSIAGGNSFELFMLSLCGLVTLIPFTLFNYSVKRIRLSTMGFLQYLAPSLQFVVGVLVFKESFGTMKMVSFMGIWIALLIFAFEGQKKNG